MASYSNFFHVTSLLNQHANAHAQLDLELQVIVAAKLTGVWVGRMPTVIIHTVGRLTLEANQLLRRPSSLSGSHAGIKRTEKIREKLEEPADRVIHY